MVATRETQAYRRDAKKEGRPLSPKERENLLRPYLPAPRFEPPARKVSRRTSITQTIRTFFQTQLHVLLFLLIHTVFSVYIRLRQAYHAIVDKVFSVLYYHHRTPELIRKDVKALNRLPEHLSVILEWKGEEKGGAGLEGLVDDVAEIAAWCTCVGIPMLSVYEKTGILTDYIPTTHRAVSKKFHSYFGRRRPSLQLRAPHMPSYLNGDETLSEQPSSSNSPGHLSILLLCTSDSRSTLIDLTKTLTEMSQRSKLSPEDISLDLIDAEISESVMGEPDLLICFGPFIELAGYPPWQVRLTEIFHVQDNNGVGYQVFLRALHRYAKAHMRFGR
ncbi:MAG: hypothetical protein M1827_007081 [Pycnora praestabilis]|nr:MAG: hypothetical protein M1827_007081 [Pycnora praestabilis]